ncbi:MAG: hypothetical protein U0892_00730 [Pirellulales bacterium]
MLICSSSSIASLTTLLSALVIACAPVVLRAEENRKAKLDKLQSILKQGIEAGDMPEGLTIRISACLGDPENRSGEKTQLPNLLIENWEFTTKHVHRVTVESVGGKRSHVRTETKTFDTRVLCRELSDGKIADVAKGHGSGPGVVLMGSEFRMGSRTIEILWNNDPILDLGETNGPALIAFAESDAKLFGALYERLASHARESYQAPGRSAPKR